MSFTIPFGGTVAEKTIQFGIDCSGRFDARGAIQNNFSVVTDGFKITFTATGEMQRYPMLADDDKITTKLITFECNGVTYSLPANNVYLRNAYRYSGWLGNSRTAKRFTKDITSGSPNKLMNLYLSVTGLVINEDIVENVNWVTGVTTVNSKNIAPYSQQVSIDNLDPNNAELYVNATFDEGDSNNKVNEDSKVTYSNSERVFTYKGIMYTIPASQSTLKDFITN